MAARLQANNRVSVNVSINVPLCGCWQSVPVNDDVQVQVNVAFG